MRSDCAVAFRASQLSFSIAGERLFDGNGVPSLVGPQLAVFNHGANMDRSRLGVQVDRRYSALRVDPENALSGWSDLPLLWGERSAGFF